VRWRSRCAALARVSGLVVAGGGRPAAANLLLTTLRVEVISYVDVLFSKETGRFQRGAAIAVLRLGGSTFAVAGTHLDLHASGRVRHVDELHAAVRAKVPDDVPVVVAGDINDTPGSAVWAALADARVDALAGPGRGGTYPARAPQRTIDGVFADPRLAVIAAEVRTGADVALASDHCPVLVELELP
jgi:endonuclease/exonuclease/phosphatase family metal-dependent hydrolase